MTYIDRVFLGSCENMSEIPDGVVDVCVTSPPYFNLRDYGVDGQIGLEQTPAEYIAKMVAVMREVRRVLKPEGTAWVNIGDSYFGDSPVRKASSEAFSQEWDKSLTRSRGGSRRSAASVEGLKPKDLTMMPHRIAIALQQDGWWVRDDIVWHKPNPMPSSVTDRCTPAKEYVFHIAKSGKYYADMESVKEPLKSDKPPGRNSRMFVDRDPAPCHNTEAERERKLARYERVRNKGGRADGYTVIEGSLGPNPLGANLRNVWTIATESSHGEHFAVMPQELARRCIAIGSPAGGLVLDPFMGSGTVATVAIGCGRHFTGYELNPEYHKLIKDRLGLFGVA